MYAAKIQLHQKNHEKHTILEDVGLKGPSVYSVKE